LKFSQKQQVAFEVALWRIISKNSTLLVPQLKEKIEKFGFTTINEPFITIH
jgi:hypothetical protein